MGKILKFSALGACTWLLVGILMMNSIIAERSELQQAAAEFGGDRVGASIGFFVISLFIAGIGTIVYFVRDKLAGNVAWAFMIAGAIPVIAGPQNLIFSAPIAIVGFFTLRNKKNTKD